MTLRIEDYALIGDRRRRRSLARTGTTPEAERLLGNFPQAFSHIGLMRIYDISEARNRG